MKIGILVSIINNFGEKGFYNSQEIGLAKCLVKKGASVVVYKLLKMGSKVPNSVEEGKLAVRYSEVRSIGINGLVDTDILDRDLDALVFFADTQLSVPKVYRWCQKNNVQLIPYIGVAESHSPTQWKKFVIDALFSRNLAVFKKCDCLVKNSNVQRVLESKNVANLTVAPVGIDLDLLNYDYAKTEIAEIKDKYGYGIEDKVILFIGRLEEEKRPLDLVRIFNQLREREPRYHLVIVGKGILYDQMMKEIADLKLERFVKYIEKIPNSDIWELYRMADVFVNLNKQEIFGMVLMEAMFYETKLVVFHAPGPDYIIQDKISGILVNSNEEMIDAILADYTNIGKNAHERVIHSLTWDNTADRIVAITKKRIALKSNAN